MVFKGSASMGLTLTIENESSLPDGGPLNVRITGKRGLDIGRDSHLDWTLPDPTRFISAKHCEVRYRDGGYWLYDVSTNGTFLHGSDGRLKAPHRLRNGDRLTIGHYIIAVELDGEDAVPQHERVPSPQPTPYHELWSSGDDSAPPIDPKLLRPRATNAPIRPDFLDWAVDVPDRQHVEPSEPRPTASLSKEDLWAQGAAREAPTPEPVPATPAPRRPVWVSSEPSGPWGAPSQPAESVKYEAPPSSAPAEPAQHLPSLHAPSQEHSASGEFVRELARGARLPESFFAQNPARLAEQLGALLRLVTENMQQLLNARGQSRRLARMSHQTTIEALNNNPLKFSPSADDALRIMFGPPTASYLDAQRALEEAFSDVKDHQMRTYAAMQQALAMIVADLDPQAIDAATEVDRGISGVIGSRKARLWDAYVARWQAKTRGQSGGLVDVFMQYFAECYDHGGATKR
jgi:type VI secretion system protein ImpI